MVLFCAAWITWAAVNSPARLISQAEAASREGNWESALRFWRSVNATSAARGSTYLEEARACLALSQAAQAERSLRQAIAADPSSLEPWRLLLEILHVEDRIVEVQRLGWEGYDQLRIGERPILLRELTLALLADLPDELVRATLHRWVAADDTDIDARVAMLQRIATQPRAADPERSTLLAAMEAILNDHPAHVGDERLWLRPWRTQASSIAAVVFSTPGLSQHVTLVTGDFTDVGSWNTTTVLTRQ